MKIPAFIRRLLPKEYIYQEPLVITRVDPDAFDWPLPIESLDDLIRAAMKLRSQALYQGWRGRAAMRLHPATYSRMRFESAQQWNENPVPFVARDTIGGFPVKTDWDMPEGHLRVQREPTVYEVAA